MKTGHQLCFFIRPEYSASAWANDLGSIDAPNLIALGSHEHVSPEHGTFSYGLPTVADREDM